MNTWLHDNKSIALVQDTYLRPRKESVRDAVARGITWERGSTPRLDKSSLIWRVLGDGSPRLVNARVRDRQGGDSPGLVSPGEREG